MTFLQFAKNEYEKHQELPEHAEVSKSVWETIKEDIKSENISEYIGNSLIISLKVKKDHGYLYFEDDMAVYKLEKEG